MCRPSRNAGKIIDPLLRGIGHAANLLEVPIGLVGGLFGKAGAAVAAVARRISGAISVVGRFGATFSGMGRRIVVGAANFAQGVIGKVEGIISAVRGLGGKFGSIGRSLISHLWNGIKCAFASGAGFAADIASAFRKWINDHTILGDRVKLPGPLPDFTMPALAGGGVVNSPLQLVGERGPEVAALPRGTRVFSAADTRQMLRPSAQPLAANPKPVAQLARVEREPSRAATPMEPTMVRVVNHNTLHLDGKEIHRSVEAYDQRLREMQ